MEKYNVISFSLWGDNPRYLDGVLENLKLAPEVYPNWKVRIYTDGSSPRELLKQAKREYGADIRLIEDKKGTHYGAYWRFFVNDDPEVDHYIIRDMDSRLNWREQAAVEEWLKSGKKFHIMRDHPHHTFEMQAGMWGGTAGEFELIPLMLEWGIYNGFGCDQFFLKEKIYHRIKDDCIVHDPFYDKKPFPEHKPMQNGGSFVGQIYLNNVPQVP